MAKFERASDEFVKLVDSMREKTLIPDWIKIEVIRNNEQAEHYKIVNTRDIKRNDTEGINFAVVFNEKNIIQLSKNLQLMFIEECLSGICVNESNDISLAKPNIDKYLNIWAKYGEEPIELFCKEIHE